MLTAEETTEVCDVLDRAADIARATPPPADPGDGDRLAAAAAAASADLLDLAERIHRTHRARRHWTQRRRPELPALGVIHGSFDPAGGGDDPPDDPPDDEVRP